MARVNFLQYEGEVFWRYMERLKDFLARFINHHLEKWEVCQIIYEGVNDETRCIIESMFDGAFMSQTVDEAWSFFEWFIQETYEWESAMHFNLYAQPLPTRPPFMNDLLNEPHTNNLPSYQPDFQISSSNHDLEIILSTINDLGEKVEER